MKLHPRPLVSTLAAAAFALTIGAAHATLVVNLQQSTTWVTADNLGTTNWTVTTGDYDGGGTANDSRATRAFSTTTAFSPIGGAYDAVQSSRFYGGGSVTKYNASVSAQTVLRNDNGTPALDLVSLGSAVSTDSATLALVWKKEDFLGGGNLAGNSVNLTGDTALSFSAAAPNASTTFSYQWLVQIGTTFYVSETKAGMTQDRGTYTSSDLTTTKWASVDLASDILSSVGAYAALELKDVQAVGVYFTSTTTSGNKRLFLAGFSADATLSAIPEPSTFAVLAGVFALAVAGLRRRRR